MLQFLDKQTLNQASIMGIIEDLVGRHANTISSHTNQPRTSPAASTPGAARSSTSAIFSFHTPVPCSWCDCPLGSSSRRACRGPVPYSMERAHPQSQSDLGHHPRMPRSDTQLCRDHGNAVSPRSRRGSGLARVQSHHRHVVSPRRAASASRAVVRGQLGCDGVWGPHCVRCGPYSQLHCRVEGEPVTVPVMSLYLS